MMFFFHNLQVSNFDMNLAGGTFLHQPHTLWFHQMWLAGKPSIYGSMIFPQLLVGNVHVQVRGFSSCI